MDMPARSPEYGQIAAWVIQIRNTDLGGVVVLLNELDTLGMDCTEASWCVGWAMECYEKGILGPRHTDGLELKWGNVEAVRELLRRIATRQGLLGGASRPWRDRGPPGHWGKMLRIGLYRP